MYVSVSNNCKNGGFMDNRVNRKGLAVVLVIALVIMAALGIKLERKEKELMFTGYENIENAAVETELSDSGGYIYVDMDGAVNNPGVYRLESGSRVSEAIEIAGGLKEGAHTKSLNKARKLTDGEKIYILTKDEASDVSEGSKLININTASVNELDSLPGIGPVYAQRIVEYRNKSLFRSVEEIKNIEGIGEKTFEKIKDYITVD